MNKETREEMMGILSKIMPPAKAISRAKNSDETYEEAMTILALSKILDWDDIQMIIDLKEAGVKNNIKNFEMFLKDSAE